MMIATRLVSGSSKICRVLLQIGLYCIWRLPPASALKKSTMLKRGPLFSAVGLPHTQMLKLMLRLMPKVFNLLSTNGCANTWTTEVNALNCLIILWLWMPGLVEMALKNVVHVSFNEESDAAKSILDLVESNAWISLPYISSCVPIISLILCVPEIKLTFVLYVSVYQ